jgi:hypothetical protein
MSYPAAAVAIGLAPDEEFGLAYLTSQITNKIIAFADGVLTRAVNKDVGEFQLILIFHQTSSKVARAISNALIRLPTNRTWLRLPYKHGRALRVPKVWLLSCESAADYVAKDPQLAKYINQAATMRIQAAVGLTTEKTPPPSNPKEFWHPRCTRSQPAT